MKKAISILLILCLMISLAGTALAEDTLVYESSFAAGNDDWFARGAQNVKNTPEATLLTEGRTADWNSPGRYFELVAGNEYKVSVEILQNDTDSANFLISMERSDSAGTGWDRLVPGKVKKGEWTTLSGTFTPAEFDSYLLYVETDGSPEISYEIRNFRLESPNVIPEAKATEAPAVIEEVAAEDLPSLKDAYAGKFDFGAAIPQQAFMGNLKLLELVKSQFNILTPENELKPDSVLDVNESRKLAQEDETAVAVHFNAAKALLQFAQQNGIKVHGHVLIWHSQTPEAFFHEGYDTKKPLVSREVMLARMENYIREVLTQTEEMYPGVIVSWDVVNEAIDDQSNRVRKSSRWTQVIGEDFVSYAFEYARKYAAEGVLLYYNDYNTAYTGKLNGIIKLITPLIEAGTIDGYGFQMHHTTGQPSNELIITAVEKIAALGIKLRVSELDIGITKYTETSLKAQADKYRVMMELMLRFADQTEAVQVWGITDNMSWRSQSYPLLFDKFMNPKPAFYAVLEAAGE
uniref:Beta-xylanase n=1 Tax=uncultured bacterium Contig35 TaxID=1393556 RepID=W0FU09_9BACT|nr:endo-1,4-beta-xylanase [uncultured bacterium Contig35]